MKHYQWKNYVKGSTLLMVVNRNILILNSDVVEKKRIFWDKKIIKINVIITIIKWENNNNNIKKKIKTKNK